MSNTSSARLTVLSTIYHQQGGEQPTALEPRYTQHLESGEQAYIRHTTVGEIPQPLDTGWVKEPALVVISNNEGKGLTQVPTAAEEAAIEARVIEIGDWIIRPGKSLIAEPSEGKTLSIRCRQGRARYTIAAYPR